MTEDYQRQLSEHFRRRELFATELASEGGAARAWHATAEQGAIDFAKEGLKAAYLINAGAIGIIVAAATPLQLDGYSAVRHALPFFAGLIAAAGFNFCAYFAQIAASAGYASYYWLEYNRTFQAFFPSDSVEQVKELIAEHERDGAKHAKVHMLWRNAAIVLAVLSLGAFIFGGAYLICTSLF